MTEAVQGQEASGGNAAAAAAAAASAAGAGGAQGGQAAQGGAQNGAAQAGANGAAQGGAAQNGQQNGKGAEASIAAGAEQQQQQDKPYWPADWREKAARHVSAGEEKIYKKELKRLEGITDPAAVFGLYREAEARLTGGGLIRVPGKDAKPEDVALYHKQLGVPENPEDYFKDIKLANDMVIGDADKPVADAFAAAVHKAGATPAVVTEAMNWYFGEQQKRADELDDMDDKFRRESTQALTEEWGGRAEFKARQAAITSLFDIAPGGTDVKNPGSVIHRLMGGRTSDGKLIGNDPDIARWLASLGLERNPMPTLVEGGVGGGQGIDSEIAEIEKVMRSDRRRYDREFAPRYAQLLSMREKLQARKA